MPILASVSRARNYHHEEAIETQLEACFVGSVSTAMQLLPCIQDGSIAHGCFRPRFGVRTLVFIFISMVRGHKGFSMVAWR